MQKGNIGVTTENIFPVIKKFLYSDHEIFLREIVSNAIDATQKIKTLYEKGEFAQLAAYITKTPKTNPRLKEANYSTSRNLPVPPPEKKIVHGWKLSDKIRVPKGYYLDKQSLREGVNPVTGYGYRTYTLLKLQPVRRRAG